jgi:membrane-bound lytic murein transglycosylase D
MRIDNSVDERLDPHVSTRAAAQFMRQNYERLGSWPLAIKAYNHGPAGIARAIRETGTTDAATIIQRYRGPAYKFASRNFYPEFLAALHVERNYRAYFGDLPLDPPLSAESVQLAQHTSMQAAARCAGTESWELASLNPGLLDAVHTGRRPIPSGYELRLPRGARERFRACVAGLPPAQVQRAARSVPAHRGRTRASGSQVASAAVKRRTHIVHKVKRGQTLGQIANQYGCSVDQIRRGNKLKGNKIRTGQVLRIPIS